MEVLTPPEGDVFVPEDVLRTLAQKSVCRITFDARQDIVIGGSEIDMPFMIQTGENNVMVNMTVRGNRTEQDSPLRISVMRFDCEQVQCADITRDQLYTLLCRSVVKVVEVPHNHKTSAVDAARTIDRLLHTVKASAA